MTSFERESQRIVIAGASSLLGAELKSLLEESRFAAYDFRLVDEELAAGTLTEAGGEPAVIQPVEEGSFEKARFVFFTGSAEFTKTNLAAAKRAGGKIIDLSGALALQSAATAWFPKLDELLGRNFPADAPAYAIPSAAGTAAAMLTLALSKCGARSLTFEWFQPVSEAGRAGIEELESQTGQLLSFHSVGQPVFDVQIAFNMLDRYGSASRQKLEAVRERVRSETKACAGTSMVMPSIQVIHAPVFYGTTFSACVELERGAMPEKSQRLAAMLGSRFTRREKRGRITSAPQARRWFNWQRRKRIPRIRGRGGFGEQRTIFVCRQQMP